MLESKIIKTNNYGIERLVAAGLISAIAGLASYVGLRGLGLSVFIAVPMVVLFYVVSVMLLAHRLPKGLDGIRKRRPWLSIVWLLIAFAAFLQTPRLSFFMLDPSQIQYSLFPGDQWFVEHCCLTAYSESTRLASEGEKNIYELRHYLGNNAHKDLIPLRKLANFNVDPYYYPPQFLLLPFMAKAVVGEDFLNLRMLWFAIGVLALMAAIGFIIDRLEPEGRMRLIGMAPFIWCSVPVLAGLQLSNVQIIVISISIIAMALFPRQRPIGGLLLAMSTVAKIFPGILIVYIIAQRKFREALWIAGFAIVLTIIALIVVGLNPFQAFIEYELPRLSSGEAFSGPFSIGFPVARNMAPFGLPLKLSWLGVPGMTLEIGRIISTIYLLIVVVLAIWAGRRQPRSNTEIISVWLSLLSLGTLVSPFAPATYVLASLVLLVCINREIFSMSATIVFLFLISAPFLISKEESFLLQAICYFPAQVIAIGIPGFVLYRAGIKNTQEEKNE